MKCISTIVLLITGFFSTAQNVGIGIANPARAKFEVQGTVGATVAIFGTESSGVSLQRNWPGIGFNQYYNGASKYLSNGYAAVQFLDPNNGYMVFDMFPSGTTDSDAGSPTRTLLLSNDGKVGIGGVVPNGLLQFPNTINDRKIVLFEGANNDHQFYGLGIKSGILNYQISNTGAWHQFSSGTGTSSSKLLMAIGGNNKVVVGPHLGTSKLGINTGDPQYTLEIMQTGDRGLLLISPLDNFDNWELRSFNGTGQAPANLDFRFNNQTKASIGPNGSYVTVSDSRLKTDKQQLQPVLSKLMHLNPVTYKYTFESPASNLSFGFIAQDVKKIFPELVIELKGESGYNGITDLKLMNYDGFGVIAIKAIQEQQLIIQQLQNQVDELKKEMRMIINKQ
jgi:Chaperone of endosialidase